MICDVVGCKIEPMRAPRVVVPSKTWLEPDHRPIKAMTTLHYCEWHKGTLLLEHLLDDKLKRSIEDVAKARRPIDFKCDFDNAFIEFVLITTPEYREFLAKLGGARMLALARSKANA